MKKLIIWWIETFYIIIPYSMTKNYLFFVWIIEEYKFLKQNPGPWERHERRQQFINEKALLRTKVGIAYNILKMCICFLEYIKINKHPSKGDVPPEAVKQFFELFRRHALAQIQACQELGVKFPEGTIEELQGFDLGFNLKEIVVIRKTIKLIKKI